MLTPNMLRVGRSNERSLNGPMRLPGSTSELLENVQTTYEAWFKVWSAAYLPKLMYQPKWWRHEADIKEEDVVLFRKHEGDVSSTWVLGIIDQLVRGRDGKARRAIVRHKNHSEEITRTTDRHVRKLVKVWSIEDQCIEDDLTELHRRLLENDQDGRIATLLGSPRCHVGEKTQKIHGPCGYYCWKKLWMKVAGHTTGLMDVEDSNGLVEEDGTLVEDWENAVEDLVAVGSVEMPLEFMVNTYEYEDDDYNQDERDDDGM